MRMTGCDPGCAHRLLGPGAWRTGGAGAASAAETARLFGAATPVWTQQCSSSGRQRSAALLGKLMEAAAQVELSADLARAWASELPLAARRLCSAGTGDDCVLGGDEPCHLLLHLLDRALTAGVIGSEAALESVHDTAVVLLQSGGGGGGGAAIRDSGALWVAAVNFGGIVVARHIRGAGDARAASAAVRLARTAVSVLGELPTAAQWATLALVYALHSKIGAGADACIVGLVAQCAGGAGCGPQTRHAAGQMLARLYKAAAPVPAAAVDGIVTLAGDCNPHVRAIWSQLASSAVAAIAPASPHPFAVLQRRLCDDRGPSPPSSSMGALPLADAMLVAEAVSGSVAAYAAGQPGHDCGLAPAALGVIEATHSAVAEPPATGRINIYTAIAAVVAAAASRIAAADSAGDGGWAVATGLLAAVETRLAKGERPDDGIFWALELVFQLCKPGMAGALLLRRDPGRLRLLARAAAACHSTALAVYVAQVAVAADGAGGDAREQLARELPWQAVSQAACCGAGDAVDALAIASAAAGSRLAKYDDDSVDRAGGFDQLRYSRQLFGSGGPTVPGPLVCPMAGTGVASRLLRLDPLRIAAGVVEPAPAGPLARLVPSAAAADSVAWADLDHPRKLACITACLATGLAAPASAVPALCGIAGGQPGPWDDALLWRCLRAARAAIVCDTAPDDPDVRAAAGAMAAMSVSGAVALDIDEHFTLPELHSSIACRAADPPAPLRDAADVACEGRPDPALAREALLCHYAGMGVSEAASDTANELLTRVLLDGRGRIRFTATGAFDAASWLVAQMATHPQAAPRLVAPALTASAVRQLAPYIPQLLAMLGASGDTVRASALTVLELLTACAPDTLALHVAVAARSQPPASHAQRLAAELLRLFQPEQTAAIAAFLSCVERLAVLPHERLRAACVAARSAHAKALSAPALYPDAAAALRQPLAILDEYIRGGALLLLSPAESDFVALIPRLRELLGRLASPACAQAGDSGAAEQAWADVFRALAAPATQPLDRVCPALTGLAGLAGLAAAIPIPVLADPAAPAYFAGAGSEVRVIGSKTRPKLLTLHLRTATGAIVQDRYIVKGSEDIRIDESVMQAFIRLNRVAAGGPATAGRQLQLPVYNVVPTDVCGGLIQVVDGSQSLFGIYSQHAAAAGAAAADAPAQLPGLHEQATHCAQRVLRDAGLPATLPFAEWPAAVAARAYDALCQTVPPDLLYARLAQGAQHSAHLFRLSRSVARSIGMASAAGYLLGLGDRHLDNLLLDVARGRLVQIDFNVGYDFGTVSHVPELVPFRMTPILAYLCGTPGHLDPEGAIAGRPFAASRVFLGAAAATLQFARMDRGALVGAIVSRALVQPFAEWRWAEEAWLRGPQPARLDAAERLHAQLPLPRHLSPADRDVWASPRSVSIAEFVRRTALNPPSAFWPRRPLPADEQPPAEPPCGWRLARGAVDRVRARLDFYPMPGEPSAATAERQMIAVWEAAASTDRLARMYAGWAPWI